MQDPNADTEWNDVLRQKGIIPPKKEKEISEQDIINILEKTVQEKLNKNHFEDKTLDELDEFEDEEDERVLMEYRRKRIEEIKALQSKAKYGEVLEISAVDYVKEVNQAGEGVSVVLHLYKSGIPLCALINQHMTNLAHKFPQTKFLKSISTTCIPNYPDKNVPTIFFYRDGEMKGQIIGPFEFGGMNLKCDDFEWKLHKLGAFKSMLNRSELDGKPKSAEDEMVKKIRQNLLNQNESDDE